MDDARVVHKEALSLLNAGHDVCLILSCNDLYEYVRHDGSVIASGIPPYGLVEYKGLKVFGLPKRNGLLGKWKTYRELSKLASDLKAEVYHAHEPDLSLAIAIRAKHLLKKQDIQVRVIHDMHEYPPGGPADTAPNLLKLPILLAHIVWNKLSMRWVDHVFTANDIVRGYALVLNHKINVDVLYNAPSLKLFPQPPSKSWSAKDKKFILCHEGSLPFNRGLKEMIEAVCHLRERVCLRIVGDVFGEREWLKQEIDKRELQDTVMITGWLPYEDISDAMNDCNAGLILFRDCMNNRMAGPPNKLFNYMNAGLPVLSVDFPEMRKIILEEDCGMLIYDQSVKTIVEVVETLLADPSYFSKMSENGQRAVRERFSWEIMEKKLVRAYERLSQNNR